VRFSDTGRGFTDVSRAFDPFYTTRPVGQGTGLGLSICYGTVKEHSGSIYAQNLEPCGAALTIELPAA
jgi:two-component system NtrC family sensor kinase